MLQKNSAPTQIGALFFRVLSQQNQQIISFNFKIVNAKLILLLESFLTDKTLSTFYLLSSISRSFFQLPVVQLTTSYEDAPKKLQTQ